MKEIINSILSKSSTPPIIIIQGDHGARSPLRRALKERIKERFSILNAYYLPNGGEKRLYANISPVNTFRVIFNYYFGANFELLEDKSYECRWKYPYNVENTEVLNAQIYDD